MHGRLVEYVVAPRLGGGWTVFRGDAPVGRRRGLSDALDFATRLAEREALMDGRATRVTMDAVHLRIATEDCWRCAA